MSGVVEFSRIDRVEPAQRAGWFYGWAVYQRGAEEFSQPFKFDHEPSTEELETEARAYVVVLNTLAVAALTG